MNGNNGERNKDDRKNEAELVEMGKFYFVNMKYDHAITEFNRALELNRENPEIYYNLGLAYEGKSDRDSAREMYEKALVINPEYAIAREHLDRILGISTK